MAVMPADRPFELSRVALLDRVNQLPVDVDVVRVHGVGQVLHRQVVLEEVEQGDIHAAQGSIGAQLGDPPVEGRVVAGVGARLVQVRGHARQDGAERPDVRLGPVPRGVVIDDWLQRVAHLVVVGHAGLGPLKAHEHGAGAHAGRGAGDEHPAARAGARLHHAAGVQQLDRLIHGGYRHVEPLAQVVLGPQPVAGIEHPGGDLLFDLPRDSLGPGQPRILENGLVAG
jgi:hypothetical protein